MKYKKGLWVPLVTVLLLMSSKATGYHRSDHRLLLLGAWTTVPISIVVCDELSSIQAVTGFHQKNGFHAASHLLQIYMRYNLCRNYKGVLKPVKIVAKYTLPTPQGSQTYYLIEIRTPSGLKAFGVSTIPVVPFEAEI